MFLWGLRIAHTWFYAHLIAIDSNQPALGIEFRQNDGVISAFLRFLTFCLC